MPVKPSSNEQEFFGRQELERLRQAAREQEERLRAVERANLRDLHWMRCPKCGMELLEVDYQGLKVDQCSCCDGVWLDAGELERIAARDRGGFLAGLQSFFKG